MPSKTSAPIIIEKPNTQTIGVTIVGETPLIVHQFSAKSKKQILDKQQKKAAKKKEAREPEKEYEQSKYKMTDGKDGFPVNAVKQAIVGSARFVDGLPMTILRGSIFVVADDLETGLTEIKYKKEEMVEDVVRLSGMSRSADLRYRPYYYDWSMDLTVKFDADILSLEQLMNLLSRAGLSQGLGEWRPERNGQNGQFTIKE